MVFGLFKALINGAKDINGDISGRICLWCLYMGLAFLQSLPQLGMAMKSVVVPGIGAIKAGVQRVPNLAATAGIMGAEKVGSAYADEYQAQEVRKK